ncbi:uncharacterized protein LOC141898582 isoform X2 [Tubulanus polymorphus]|uniref:uncharacterized protein LOC141898582 isoform X2 n=1 Tax=Tubulanus polymorphus TaxID=672921 RepID=UPI003DA43625
MTASTNWKYEERPEEPPLILGVGTNLGLGVASVWGQGLAPIHLAALHGRIDCLRLLIEKHHTDVNIASKNGWRPLHLCISNQTGARSLKCLIYLLEHNADPDVVNEDGVAPVHQAASEGHVQCLKVLIEIGAKIDVVDNRNHRPIDLAKLWSHKKCARILANEMWHNNKSLIAADMNQLRKVKLQQVLHQIERENTVKPDDDESHFYGKQAYDDWLNNDQKKQRYKQQKKPVKPKIQFKESLHKPNSNKQSYQVVTAEKEVITEDAEVISEMDVVATEAGEAANKSEELREKKVVIVTADDIKTPSTTKSEKSDREGDLCEEQDGAHPHEEQNDERFYNTIVWNHSTKIPDKQYISNLSDAYPRDIYTMLPLNNSTPKELNIRHNPKIFVTDSLARVKRADKEINLKLRHVENNNDEMSNNLKRVADGNDDVVLYKCKSVLDVESKRKTESILNGVNESGMHLTNDIHSPIFKSGLLIQPVVNRAASSSASTSSSTSSLSARGEQSFPRERVLSMLKRVTNNPPPIRLPPIDAE